MSGLEKFLRVDDLAVLCDGEVQVRRHGSLSERGRADRADDLSGGDVLLRRDGRDALKVGVGGLVAAVVRDDDGGAHQIVVRDGEHRAGAGGEHLRAGVRLDVDAVVCAPVGERFAVSELVMLKAATVSPLRGETMSRGATGVTGSVTSGSFSETVTSTTDCTGSAGLLRLDLGNVRGDRLCGDGSRDRRLGHIGRCFVVEEGSSIQ